MNALKALLLACVVALAAAAPASAQGRQYYSKTWQKKGSYYYRTYYYKPTPTYTTYRYHYVVYYPTRPRYYYYYNPYKGQYWGRFDIGEEGYSELPEKERKEKLAEVPESAFPAPGEMPKVPESEDGLKIDTPPKGLPVNEEEEVVQEKMKEMLGKKAEKELPRQVYSDWVEEGSGASRYYYSCYYYQPTYGGAYKSHRVIYYPSRPRYVYYYNPYKGRYWGRYDLQEKGYSLLKEEDRKEKLSEVPESAFPAPGKMPPLPESKDGVEITPPPARPS